MGKEGGCLCGKVRYAVEGPPLASIVCHCRSCRKASAAPSAAWLSFERSRFEWRSGAVAAFDSSEGVTRSFCAACGTPLLYENAAEPAMLDVATVSLDEPEAFPPTREVWLEHRIAWEATNAALGRYPRGTGDGPYPGDPPVARSAAAGSAGESALRVRAYADALHRPQVIELWQAALGYGAAHNAPGLSIDRKLAVDDGLFFVAVSGQTVVGTVLAGYDGHRGWLYSVAVRGERRHEGIGTLLVRHAEEVLTARGCVKINLQIADGNDAILPFYEALGYAVEPRVSMGKRIAANVPRG